MDNRKHLHIPENFAFIIRSGGANLCYSEFIVSNAIAIAIAIAIGNVKHIALVGHNNCGMVNFNFTQRPVCRGTRYQCWLEQRKS